jgi:hypothetical protein
MEDPTFANFFGTHELRDDERVTIGILNNEEIQTAAFSDQGRNSNRRRTEG